MTHIFTSSTYLFINSGISGIIYGGFGLERCVCGGATYIDIESELFDDIIMYAIRRLAIDDETKGMNGD